MAELTTGDMVAGLAIRGHRVRVAAAGGPPAPGKPGHSKYVCSCGVVTLRPWGQVSSWPDFVRGHHTAVLEGAANVNAGDPHITKGAEDGRKSYQTD